MNISTVLPLSASLLLLGCATETDEDLALLEDVASTAPADVDVHVDVERPLHAATVPECPGVPTTGIDSYEGFTGYYLRGAPYVEGELVTLNVLTLERNPDWIGVDGNYQALVRRGGLFAYELGRYLAVPNNPAIGPALGLDLDRDGAIDELYWVLGATRNLYGRIDKLCLGKSRDDGSGSPFLMTRLGG